MAVCKRCGAQITWRRTTRGRMMPIDPRPNDDGDLVADVMGLLYVAPPDERAKGRTFMPHWSTCGKAAAAPSRATAVIPPKPDTGDF